LAPGAVVSAVCKQHGIGSGQLSVWRQQFREGRLGEPLPPVVNFAQAVVTPAPTLAAPDEPPAMCGQAATSSRRQRPRSAAKDFELIEIALPNGILVRVGSDVDQAALGRVLAALKSA
jgi:transposase